jgi:UrcA family protein
VKSTVSIAALSAAAGLLSAALAPAHACDNPTGRPTNYGPMTVQVLMARRGLNLSNEADAAVFLQRLSMAAANVCDPRARAPLPVVMRGGDVRACQAEALARAMAQVSSPAVKRRYAQLQSSSVVHIARR